VSDDDKPVTPPTLDHIEKTLADAYRKEIDQEENIWRSLPFFAATLAFELTALFQMIDRLPPYGTGGWIDAVVWSILAFASALVALVCLSVSVFPARFRYIAPEPELLDYAEGLDQDELEGALDENGRKIAAIVVLKAALARQYASATHSNRQVNQGRGLWRSVAGVAIILAAIFTLALVATVLTHYHPKT
jgi:hypothetical protein